jgi:hypothetical protein
VEQFLAKTTKVVMILQTNIHSALYCIQAIFTIDVLTNAPCVKILCRNRLTVDSKFTAIENETCTVYVYHLF